MPLLKKKLTKAIMKAEQLADIPKIKIEVKLEDQPANPLQPHSKGNKPGPIQERKYNPALKQLKTESSHAQESLRNEEKRRKSANSAKNIVKNFARAMITFTLSNLAYPYLSRLYKLKNVDVEAYREYFKQRKENMDGISSLRALLLVEGGDEHDVAEFKRIFQYSCEIFLKYFSVNWVYSSKVGDKISHVKARFKLLRRIQNPEYFTYFKL